MIGCNAMMNAMHAKTGWPMAAKTHAAVTSAKYIALSLVGVGQA
jgi:hypothetical protein